MKQSRANDMENGDPVSFFALVMYVTLYVLDTERFLIINTRFVATAHNIRHDTGDRVARIAHQSAVFPVSSQINHLSEGRDQLSGMPTREVCELTSLFSHS